MKNRGQSASKFPEQEVSGVHSKSAALERDRAYLEGIRECFGTLETAVSLLPMERRSEFTDKLKELFDKVRAAEKRVGEGTP